MNSTQLGRHLQLWPSVLALVACTMWCTTSRAQSAGGRHQRDHVTISGTPATTVAAGQTYAFSPSASDNFGRTLVFAVANKPAWAAFSTSTGQLSGVPGAASVGTYSNIVIAVSDGLRSATLPAFSVQVLAGQATAPPPPTISGTPATSDVAGSPYSFQPSASGPSGMTLSYSVQNKPAWASFSIATGLLAGTPSSTQTGTYGNIVVSVSDGQASSALPSFAITVTPGQPSGSATVSVTPPTQNTDGSPLTDLAGVTIYYGTSQASLGQSVQIASTTPTSYTISGLTSGTWYFAGAAYTSAGTAGAMSGVVSKTIQ